MPERFKARTIVIIALAVLVLTGTSRLIAQDVSPTTPTTPTPKPDQQTQFSEETLKTFASAYVKVNEINEAYAPFIEQSVSPEQAMKYQQDASDAMIKAIEEEGMELETYNTVANAVANDPELGEKVKKLIEQMPQGR